MSISVVSWSGGKDSALALHHAIALGLNPTHLIVMMDESGEQSHSHGLSKQLLHAQAHSLGMTLLTASASWQTYERTFIDQLICMQLQGLTHAIFGDIDIEAHKLWEDSVAAAAGLIPVLPLWQQSRLAIVQAVLEAKIKPVICGIRKNIVPLDFLGRVFDATCVKDLCDLGIDPCGETGEFHTVVVDSIDFQYPISYHLGSLYETETTYQVNFIVDS